MSEPPTIDDYFNRIAPTSHDTLKAQREEQQARAEAAGIPVEDLYAQDLHAQLAASKAADDAARAQRDAANAAERAQAQRQLTAWGIAPPAPGTHPAMRAVYREQMRLALVAVRQQAAEEERLHPERAAKAAIDRQYDWEDQYRAKHGRWPTDEEIDAAGMLSPFWREKWEAKKRAAAGE
jgi:hypothetical protein